MVQDEGGYRLIKLIHTFIYIFLFFKLQLIIAFDAEVKEGSNSL